MWGRGLSNVGLEKIADQFAIENWIVLAASYVRENLINLAYGLKNGRPHSDITCSTYSTTCNA